MGSPPYLQIVSAGAELALTEIGRRVQAPTDLHELRLDLLDHIGDEVFDLIRELGPRAVVTCRSRLDGGGFSDNETDRARVMARAADAGAGYLDWEARAVESDGMPDFLRAARARGARWVGSAHLDDARPDTIHAATALLTALAPDVAKLAVPVSACEELLPLVGLRLAPTQVIIGMGPAGVWTRLRPHDFGSAWTFAPVNESRATAPGQVPLARALAWRLRESAALAPIVLLGGANVHASPGPDVYNAVFRHLGLPFQYLPLQARSAGGALRVMEAFGVHHASVTMPFKEGFSDLVGAGPINSLRLTSDRWEAINTDATGFGELLDEAGIGAKTRALILGAGATAFTLGEALSARGATVCLALREPLRAAPRAVVQGFELADWGARHLVPHDLLINATPLDDPWPPGLPLRAPRIIDTRLSRPAPTPLIARARAEGRRATDGLEFWLRQGAHQMSWMLGIELGPRALRAELEDTWTADASPPAPAATPPDPVRLRAPGSKSLTQRALILAALADGPSRLRGASPSADSNLLAHALTRLGARITRDGADLGVTPAPLHADGRPIWCGNAGTTLRFAAALSLLLEEPLHLWGDARLGARPQAGLLEPLAAAGVEVTRGEPGGGGLRLTLRGPGQGGEAIDVDTSASSQFLSALLMAGCRLPGGLTLTTHGARVSWSYLEMTTAMMRRAGVPVTIEGDRVTVTEAWPEAMDLDIEPDWSGAAFWLAAGALTGRRVKVPGLREDSAQGDQAVVAHLAALTASSTPRLDLEDAPDLLPPLAVVALFADRPVELRGAAHARLKESDRVEDLAAELRKTGAQVEALPDGLDVRPGAPLHGARLHPHDDHRLAMAFGVLSLRVPGIEVTDPGVVAKSFPSFWDELEQLR
jgi:3-phosphoshikimate 1-carboxyvinyltransferase